MFTHVYPKRIKRVLTAAADMMMIDGMYTCRSSTVEYCTCFTFRGI